MKYDISEVIKQLVNQQRTKAHMSSTALDEKANLKPGTVAKIELTGESDIDTLNAIAQALNKTLTISITSPTNEIDFDEDILADLIKENYPKKDILPEFKQRKARIQKALNDITTETLKHNKPQTKEELAKEIGLHANEEFSQNKMKKLDYYMKLNYPYTITPITEDDGEKYFELSIPILPGFKIYEDSVEDLLNNLDDAKRAWFVANLNNHRNIPEPKQTPDVSGRLTLRMPKSLHLKLLNEAQQEKISLNSYIKFAK